MKPMEPATARRVLRVGIALAVVCVLLLWWLGWPPPSAAGLWVPS